MAVRNTFSSRDALGNILTALSPLSTLAKESTMEEIKPELEEINMELKRIRTGHELYLWEEEVNEIRGEE